MVSYDNDEESETNFEVSEGSLPFCFDSFQFIRDNYHAIRNQMSTSLDLNHLESNKNFVGIYLEGPFISPSKIGAQNPKYISKPDIKMLKNLQEVSGELIKFCAIAPEVEGAEKFIEKAKNLATLSDDPGDNQS